MTCCHNLGLSICTSITALRYGPNSNRRNYIEGFENKNYHRFKLIVYN